MNLRRLDYFLAVAEERHFRRAAERLHVAQPALSVQIAKLERELGTALFQRNRRGVDLTAAGRALQARMRSLVPSLRDAFAEATATGEGRAGQVTVGFIGSSAYQLLPHVLRQAERKLPAVQITLQQMTSIQQFEALATGRIDIGVARVPSPSRLFASTRLSAEPFVVAVPTGHPLAARSAVAARQLDGLPLVTVPIEAGVLRDMILAEIADAGACARIVDEAIDMPTILGLVAAGRGVALVPAAVASLSLKGVVYRHLKAPKRRAELWLVRRREDHRPVIATLADLLMKAAP